ncbi:Nucleoredoxin [Durusdinium trenchii]|uniref:Nucleoredoxin n=1 Tax=Durusdinium trenchii TaxID=1381693 RepID=A0ABP0IQG7_9DINO
MEALLGETLLGPNGQHVETASLEEGVVALLFSASWCGPCLSFKPMLIKFYEEMKKQGKAFEVVFVSSDRDQESFDEYFSHQPWLAVPYEARDIKNKLSRKLKVSGIPTLAFADAKTGEVYETGGRGIVMSDPEGAKYPWVPPSIDEALGDSFISNDGSVTEKQQLDGKYLMLYFSASWCPPCRQFSPILIECYNKLIEDGKDVELIYISSDRTQEDYDGYFAKMPWLAIPFGDDRKDTLSSRFGVEGIPTLIMLDQERAVLNKGLREYVTNDPVGADFPWAPKPVLTLEQGVGEINDMPAMVFLMEDEAEGTKAQFESIIAPIAEEHKELVKSSQAEEALFLLAGEPSPIAGRIRSLCGLQGGDKADDAPVKTLCNGDMCVKLDPATTVIILDIPDQGGFYEMTAELTKENIISFWSEFKQGSLKPERKQLGQ